ncbi:MAG TPA: hypothetical protein VD962_01400 [Rubricoccaceae bacterium]|nr:hypothetical protein [Rubricoccaceae bacterium]
MGANSDRQDLAIGFLGADEPSDYVLAPAAHAERYAASAPALAARLGESDVRAAAERYEERDRRALEAQARFTTTSERAQTAVFFAGIAGVLLIATGSLAGVLDDTAERILAVAFAIGAVAASALAYMWIREIEDGQLLRRWMTLRAEAESQRLRYFDLLVSGPPLEEPLLQLEYFRRYQLDVQRLYYKARGEQHRQDADQALTTTTRSMAAAAIASGIAGILSGAFGAPWASLAGVGLVAQALASRVANREAAAQHRRNAERYERTRETLDELYGRLDAVRAATASGDLRVMREFAAAVHEQLSLEHRQWLEDTREASPALNRLEELLHTYEQRAHLQG